MGDEYNFIIFWGAPEAIEFCSDQSHNNNNHIPQLPHYLTFIPVQELDREEDCCMQHAIIPWLKERES